MFSNRRSKPLTKRRPLQRDLHGIPFFSSKNECGKFNGNRAYFHNSFVLVVVNRRTIGGQSKLLQQSIRISRVRSRYQCFFRRRVRRRYMLGRIFGIIPLFRLKSQLVREKLHVQVHHTIQAYVPQCWESIVVETL